MLSILLELGLVLLYRNSMLCTIETSDCKREHSSRQWSKTRNPCIDYKQRTSFGILTC